MNMITYQNLIDEKNENANRIRDFWDTCQPGGSVVPEAVLDAEERNQRIEETIGDLPTVNVSYYIGHRRYFDSVIKLGKSYFDRGRKMTARAGFRGIAEIDEITEEMDREMTADSYWY